jgi:MOSC domain-containing protein YiiM
MVRGGRPFRVHSIRSVGPGAIEVILTTVQEPEPSVVGSVRRLGVKSKISGERGLPKPEVQEVLVRQDGLVGDYNLYRQTQRSGDPDMAVLLVPEETIGELNRDGWPVRAGDLGENITTSGIPYDKLRPSATVRIGEVVLRTVKPCEPCTNLYLLPYVGDARGPAFLKATLGRRGWFARVVREGRIHRGDRVEVDRKEGERASSAER